MTKSPNRTSGEEVLLTALVTGSSEAGILAQEARGQAEIVRSEVIPSDLRGREELETLGFTFGEPLPSDPMFMPASLPDGWRREGSDHAMWSYVVDELGRRRVAIFYKAAFYDRRAHAGPVHLSSYLYECVSEGKAPTVGGNWPTASMVTELAAMATREDDEARKWREDDEARKWREDDGHVESSGKWAAEHEQRAVKYRDLAKTLG